MGSQISRKVSARRMKSLRRDTKSINNGWDTLFWREKWVTDIPLIQSAIGVDLNTEIEKTVADYWTNGRGWDWNALGGKLSDKIKDAMKYYAIVEQGEVCNEIYWRDVKASGRKEWGAFIPVMVWWLWRWRNNAAQQLDIFEMNGRHVDHGWMMVNTDVSFISPTEPT
nr:uncharacterized protein LOC109181186 [Ipomoea batatas]